MAEEDEVFEPQEDSAEEEAAEGESRPRWSFSVESENLCEQLVGDTEGERLMARIADRCYRTFEADWESTAEWRERFWSEWKLFAGDIKPKSFPFDGCANVALPMATENFLRVLTRMMSEVFGDFSNIAVYQSTGPDDIIAQPLTTHTNWQLRYANKSFRREMERAALLYWIPGDFTIASYYDPETRRICHETLTPDEFVVPFGAKSVEIDYGDAPHYTRVLQMSHHALMERAGVWVNVDSVLDAGSSHDDDPESGAVDAARSVSGAEAPIGDDGVEAPYKILQWEGWDDGVLGMGRDVWIRAHVDHKSQQLLCLTIHEIEDWRDVVRAQNQQRELDDYTQAKQQHDMMQEQADGQEQAAAIAQLAFAAPGGGAPELPPPPPPPSWATPLPDGSLAPPHPPRSVPMRLFTHGVCIENFAGMLGLGFGRIQTELNRAANTVYNQMVDQATVANVPFFLALDSFGLDGQEIELVPGKVIKVRGLNSSEDLQNGLREIRPSQANPQLGDVAMRLYDLGQSSMTAPDVLSGAEGKSGETFRGLASRIEQATKQLSYFGQKFAYILENVLSNHAYLNSAHMPEEEFAGFSEGSRVTVKREWYRLGYTVGVRSDLSFTPRAQRIAEADEVLQMVMSIPHLTANLAIVYEAIKASLQARGKEQMVRLLGAPPPPPQQFMPPPPPPPQQAPQQAPQQVPA